MADYGYGAGSDLRAALEGIGLNDYTNMFPPNAGAPTPEAPVPMPRRRPPMPPQGPPQQFAVPQTGTPAVQATNPGPAPPPPALAPAGSGPVPLPPGGVNMPMNFGAAQRLRDVLAARQAAQPGRPGPVPPQLRNIDYGTLLRMLGQQGSGGFRR
jgi:hypothetical protein